MANAITTRFMGAARPRLMQSEAPRPLRIHPDIFSPEDAVEYLRLDGPNTLRHLREAKILTGHKVGKNYMYWREDLDVCALKLFGRHQQYLDEQQRHIREEQVSRNLKAAGGRR